LRNRHPQLRPGPLARLRILALVLVAACEGDPSGPGQGPQVVIDPAAPVAVYTGDTLTVRASVRNSTHPQVRFTSSEPEVATVDVSTGEVRAAAVGEAVITAASAIDPRIFAELRLTVLPDLPASLTLAALLDDADEQVDPRSVRGALRLRLDVQRGNAHRLEVRLGDAVVCDTAFAPPGSEAPPAAEIPCLIDTAEYDEADGTPVFMNGSLPLRASLLAGGDRELATMDAVDLSLANRSVIVTHVQTGRQAVDLKGQRWVAGDVAFQAQPVLYDEGARVSRLTFSYRRPDGGDTTAVAEAVPFAFVLPAGGMLSGVTDPALQVAVTSTDAEGKVGPAGATEPLRFDGSAPMPGMLVARDWVGANTTFASTYDATSETDAGVGRTHLRFFAGDPALTAEEIALRGQPVTKGSDLAQAAAESYRLATHVCDGLDNCVLVPGYLFGVDLTPPLVETSSLSDQTANPGTDLLLGVRDDLSGFPALFLEATTRLLDASPATVSCGPSVEDIDLPGRQVETGCVPDTVPNPLPVPRTSAGYYRYDVVAFDRAGNRSEPVRRTILVDLEPPAVGVSGLPEALVPGEDAAVTLSADDDVDLWTVDLRLVYPLPAGGALGLPFQAPWPAGIPFDDNLSAEASINASFPFVRTLTYGGGTAGMRATVVIDSLRAVARDAASLRAASALRIPREAFGNDTTTLDPFPRFATMVTTVDRTAVCTAGCGAGDPTHLRITVRVEGESGTGRPFARLHLYRRDAAGLLEHLGSVAGTDVTITDTGAKSTYVYALDHLPPAELSGDFTVVAVGVSSRGNALASALGGAGAPTVTFYRR
jgi:hypothetical protein